MFVSQIISSKPKQDIVTISPDATVSAAAKLLSDNRIGAVIVNASDTEIDGILSERDIVRELGRRGPNCLSDKVAELMTRELVSSSPDETADQVMEKMTAGRFRHLPVIEYGDLLGIISIGDVVKRKIQETEEEAASLREYIATG